MTAKEFEQRVAEMERRLGRPLTPEERRLLQITCREEPKSGRSAKDSGPRPPSRRAG